MAEPEVPGARQDAHGNRIPEPEEELALLEREIHELRLLFEKYFSGAERTAPLRRRDRVAERIRRITGAQSMRTTAAKLRLEQTASRFAAYDRMWTRTLAEKESGTYTRDVFRMRLHRRGEATAPPPAKAPDPMLSDGQIRALFDVLTAARRRTGESVEGLTPESLAARIRRDLPGLLKRFDCRAIEFQVVVRNGKALLKAVPRG